MSGIGLSKSKMEFLFERQMMGRLSKIVWGINCDTLKEALTISGDWLFEAIKDDKEKQELSEYLFQSGALPKVTIISGIKHSTWTIPSDTKKIFTVSMKEIVGEYEKSFFLTLRNMQERIDQDLLSFLHRIENNVGTQIHNRLYRKCLINRIEQYNSFANEANNSLKPNMLKTNRVLFYQMTKYEDMIYLSKNGLFDTYIETAEARYEKQMKAKIRLFFEDYRVKVSYYVSRPRFIMTDISVDLAEGFKDYLQKMGFKVAFLPQTSIYAYADLDIKRRADQIPVFMEVEGEIQFKPYGDDFVVNKSVRDFCNCYNWH